MLKTLLRPATIAILLLASPSRAADVTFEVSKTDASAPVGKKAKASVTITAKKGWHLNAEAPLTLKMTPAAGVVIDKAKLGRGDLALSNDTTARFDVGLLASEPGKLTVEAEAGFVLCQETACRPIKEKLTFTVDTTAPKVGPEKRPLKKK
jgi:hypothetical protein